MMGQQAEVLGLGDNIYPLNGMGLDPNVLCPNSVGYLSIKEKHANICKRNLLCIDWHSGKKFTALNCFLNQV